MVAQKPKKQDLVRLRDEYFEQVFKSKKDKNKVCELLINALNITKKLNNSSKEFTIWIECPGENGESNRIYEFF